MDSTEIFRNPEVQKVVVFAHGLIEPEDLPVFEASIDTALENVGVAIPNQQTSERNIALEKNHQVVFAAGIVLGAACALAASRASISEAQHV